MLVPAVSDSEWPSVINLASAHEGVLAAIGIHPWAAHHYDRASLNSALDQAEMLLRENHQLQIGEIGLDFDVRTPAAQAWQIEVLTGFLDLAVQHERLVSIHLRKAFEAFSHIIKSYPCIRGFLHGFSGGISWARHFCSDGRFKVGVNGVVCRDNARRYHQLVREAPFSWLVLETDGPFVKLPKLTSFSCMDIQAIAQQIAVLRNLELEEVVFQTERNAREVIDETLG